MLGDSLFAGHLDEDEEVTMIVHKHWLLGLRILLKPVVYTLAIITFAFLFPYEWAYYVAAVAGVAAVVWLLRNFYDYYLDAWIVTDQGIIDVEWHGWFHRESTRVLYSDIQGVSYEIQGVLSTIMRFGTISVEKISTGSAISLEKVASPKAVEAVILKNMEGYLHTKNLGDAKHVQEILSQIVAREIQLGDFDREEDDDEYDEDDDYDDDDDEEYEYDDDDEDDRWCGSALSLA